jgi:hypothetical protein
MTKNLSKIRITSSYARFLPDFQSTQEKLNRKLIGMVIVIVLAISITLVIIFIKPIDVVPPEKEEPFKDWNRSGPFAINEMEYKIGDNIFLAVEGLMRHDIGNIVFVLPNSTTKYITIPFDGTEKSGFNQYFRPALSKNRGICSMNDIVGEWTVVFQGTNYKSIKFIIRNETASSETGIFKKVC